MSDYYPAEANDGHSGWVGGKDTCFAVRFEEGLDDL